jgi:predicted anti-sigma-YlaC factor YlaD
MKKTFKERKKKETKLSNSKMKNNKEHIDHLLFAYTENSLSPSEIKKAEEHLQVCEDCQNKMDFFNKVEAEFQHEKAIQVDDSQIRIHPEDSFVLSIRKRILNHWRTIAAVLIITIGVASGYLMGITFYDSASTSNLKENLLLSDAEYTSLDDYFFSENYEGE